METMHTTATETPAHVATETPAHVARLIEALSLAVSDRRRVDELVTLFEYDGLVEAAGERYSGQGAVKRFFSSLLLENGFTSMDVLAEPSSNGADDAALRLGLTSATGTDEVALRLKFSNGMVSECHLQAAEGACSPAGCLLPSASEPSEKGGGPKWETFDGRVRQKIWQRQDCFEVGRRRGKSRPRTHTRPEGPRRPCDACSACAWPTAGTLRAPWERLSPAYR